MSYALVLSGNRLLTSGATGTNSAAIQECDASWSQLVNGDSAPELERQPQESRQQLEKVMHLVENPANDQLSLAPVRSVQSRDYLRCQQLVCFAFRQPNPAANLSGSRRSTQGSNPVLLWLLMNLSQLSPSVFLSLLYAAAVLIYLPSWLWLMPVCAWVGSSCSPHYVR